VSFVEGMLFCVTPERENDLYDIGSGFTCRV